MMKAIIRKGRIYYHDSLSFHVKEEGIIVPLSLVLHVLEQEEAFTYAFSHLTPTAFPSWPDLVGREKGNSIHSKRMCVGGSPHNINTRIP